MLFRSQASKQELKKLAHGKKRFDCCADLGYAAENTFGNAKEAAAWARFYKFKRIVLVTNAHGKSLSLKLERTQLGGHFDAVVCAHDLGLPKEHLPFWEKMQSVEQFDKHAALLIDDSLPVLRSARHYGIAQLLAVKNPDSKGPQKDAGEFAAFGSFTEIMP